MTFHSDVPYLEHILEAIDDMEQSTRGISKETFIENKDVRDANIRRLEIIGEAVKNISDKTKRKYPKVPWKEIAGTRDKMIHHYFGVDLNLVWDILKNDIPLLKQQMLKIKQELKKSDSH